MSTHSSQSSPTLSILPNPSTRFLSPATSPTICPIARKRRRTEHTPPCSNHCTKHHCPPLSLPTSSSTQQQTIEPNQEIVIHLEDHPTKQQQQTIEPNQEIVIHHQDHPSKPDNHNSTEPMDSSDTQTKQREILRKALSKAKTNKEKEQILHQFYNQQSQKVGSSEHHHNHNHNQSQHTSGFPGKGASAGCEHYKRNCWIKADCCQKYYPCRRCHDEHEDHEINRHDTKLVACVKCGDIDQPVAERCRTCNVKFAKYFCQICKFYDDDPDKDIYHCKDCGICRVGKGIGIDNHHCHGCNSCIPIDSVAEHPCRASSLDANCPICTYYLATSTEPVVFMRCGHAIHVECFNQHTARDYTCPLCHKSLTDMEEWYRALDERIAKDVIPPEYQNRVSKILCYDCNKKSEAPFHFVYHRCAHCHGYNTRVLHQYDKQPNPNQPTISSQTSLTHQENSHIERATT